MTFQIFDGSTVPQRMVDGWNAFFCDNLDDLVSLLEENLLLLLLSCSIIRIRTKCKLVLFFCLHSIDVSQSCSRTQSLWESCGWGSCAFTQKNLTSRSMSSASAKENASPPLKNSGPANALPLKVIRSPATCNFFTSPPLTDLLFFFFFRSF